MKTNPRKSRHNGFALIVTLSLMILLTVVAVGLLTLSSITLRSTAQGTSQAIANSNARLALMLAIGDLQKHLGPDQRISAPASSLSTVPSGPPGAPGVHPQPNVVGAWTSLGWQGPTGAPPLPSQKSATGMFRGWLVSTANVANSTDLTFPTKAPAADSIWLTNPATTGTLTANSLGNPDLNNPTMKAERVPLSVGTNRGGFAWMVSDNSTKVPINLKSITSVQLAENLANRTAATGPRPDVLSKTFEKITDPGSVISMQTAVLAVGKDDKQEINARSQSLTNSSLGLLTNPVSGGLKTDLTPLMELPTTTSLTNALGSATPYFHSNSATGDGAPTWDYLRSHYQLYKKVTGQATGSPRYKLQPNVDLSPSSSGYKPKPTKEVLLPVIAKLQIIFSLVSHHSHITNRVADFTNLAIPKGNNLHAVPHLVYDPVITLYNPYDVAIELSQLRIQVSDPPVGFQFQKHDKKAGTNPWFRQEFASGSYHGLARFQHAKEKDQDARKTFTLHLKNMTSEGALASYAGTPAGSLLLLPGEVKVFAPRVESKWNWKMETDGGDYNPRSFFDWDNSRDMGNTDNRTKNLLGVEAIPKPDFRAGLQTDHLTYANGRSNESKYSWEYNPSTNANIGQFGQGWLSMRAGPGKPGAPDESDDITVNCKPQRCVNSAALPDFRVDIMSGLVPPPATSDILRTYEFRLGDVPTEMSTTGSPTKPITRKFRNYDLLQILTDTSTGGKSPFAIFTMSAKTTKDTRDDSKAWLFNNMVTEGGSHDSGKIGNAAQSYDLRLQEISDFTIFPGVEYDSVKQRGYFGAVANTSQGATEVPMYRVPLTPASSLGDWIAGNLVASSQFPRVNYPLGNSFAHPLIPSDNIQKGSPMLGGAKVLDHTYLMNAALWDSYYFSTATSYSGAAFNPKPGKPEVLENFFTGKKPMLNSRLVPYISGTGDPKTIASDFAAKTELIASKEFAKNAMIQGAFNINSDSVDAWRAVLSSLRDASVMGYTNKTLDVKDRTAFVRNGLPNYGSPDDASPSNSVNAKNQIRWAGFRTLTDKQLEELATLIVAEIRTRGAEDKAPSLCLADFINRRLGSASSTHALKGILQTAIDKSKINDNSDFHDLDSNNISGSALAANRTKGLNNTAALNGFTADGAAPMLTQGDLLTGLAPIITARGDTFTIRSYGEARAANGTTVIARAWCEATVQRIPEFVDTTNAPEVAPTSQTPTNVAFGRRFVVTSFRWLNASEI